MFYFCYVGWFQGILEVVFFDDDFIFGWIIYMIGLESVLEFGFVFFIIIGIVNSNLEIIKIKLIIEFFLDCECS